MCVAWGLSFYLHLSFFNLLPLQNEEGGLVTSEVPLHQQQVREGTLAGCEWSSELPGTRSLLHQLL